jgi:hypothetical protein
LSDARQIVDLGGGGALAIEIAADEADELQLALFRLRREGGGYRPVAGAALIIPIGEAEEVGRAILALVGLAERAEAAGTLRLDPSA